MSKVSPEFVREKKKLLHLELDNFGPFSRYEIDFMPKESECILLTGKNNEGKSNIILAIKLLDAATRAVGHRQLRMFVKDSIFYRLTQADVEGLLIGRLIHNYEGDYAKIHADFDDNSSLDVVIDVNADLIYSYYDGRPNSVLENIFGIIPPLGPLAEHEEKLSLKHIRESINSTLAPRHLRNHFIQILTPEEYRMVQEIVNNSWPSIQLEDCEWNKEDNTLRCFFKESRIPRELCWAGQGLQVWFQIVTHMVRLRNSSIIILDEPEINLHPEKQNDLIQLLKEYHTGNALIATHSVELMNNVNVSHIVHVQKAKQCPITKSTKDRNALDIIRSKIGSNFNLVASQFEAFDRIIFTEEITDYKILVELAEAIGKKNSAFNIPTHGFSNYFHAPLYKEAHKLMIGGELQYSMLLDRDYYPEEYLNNIKGELALKKIKLIFTPGKEIENIFLSQPVLLAMIPREFHKKWNSIWEKYYEEEYIDCHGSFLTLHTSFLSQHLDAKAITMRYTPDFNKLWKDHDRRHLLLHGKKALSKLRGFYREHCCKNLTNELLVKTLIQVEKKETEKFLQSIFGT